MKYIATAEDAEANAAEQMRLLGFADAVVTAAGADGGVDVRATRALAQVKWRTGQVGRPEVQRLFGARGTRYDQQLIFYSASPFTAQAIEYANGVDMALFTYDPTGRTRPENVAARLLVEAARGRRPVGVMQPQRARATTGAKHPARRQVRYLVPAVAYGVIAFLFACAALIGPGEPSSVGFEIGVRTICLVASVPFAVHAVRRLRSSRNPRSDSTTPVPGRRVWHPILTVTYGALAVFFGAAVFAGATGQAPAVDVTVRSIFGLAAVFFALRVVGRLRADRQTEGARH